MNTGVELPMSTVNAAALAMSPEEITAFCERNRIQKLSLFGSIVTDRFRPESDIDVLVEFVPGSRISLFDVAGMELDLTEKLGRKVDVDRVVREEDRQSRHRHELRNPPGAGGKRAAMTSPTTY